MLSSADWDISLAGKGFSPAEPICQWIAALVGYHLKKAVRIISTSKYISSSLNLFLSQDLSPTLLKVEDLSAAASAEESRLSELKDAMDESRERMRERQEERRLVSSSFITVQEMQFKHLYHRQKDAVRPEQAAGDSELSDRETRQGTKDQR